jgi:hypothetical protein
MREERDRESRETSIFITTQSLPAFFANTRVDLYSRYVSEEQTNSTRAIIFFLISWAFKVNPRNNLTSIHVCKTPFSLPSYFIF